MSYGGFNEFGLVLRGEDLKQLLKYAKKEILDIDNEYDTIEEFLDEYDLYEFDNDYVSRFEKFYVSRADFLRLIGKLDKCNWEDIESVDSFYDENLFVIELLGNSIFTSYNNIEEVYKEIEDELVDSFGIDLERLYKELGDTWLKDRIGKLQGFFEG
jgi:ADP-glucose pyrophosphorylase